MTGNRARAAARRMSIAFAIVLLTLTSIAQERDRAKIPDKYKWNLADIYPTDAAWRAAKDKLQAELPAARAVQGQAGVVGSRRWPTRSTRCTRSTRSCRACTSTRACSPTRTRATRRTRACGRRWCSWPPAFAAEASYVEPEILRVDAAPSTRFVAVRAAAEDLPLLPGRHRAARARTR